MNGRRRRAPEVVAVTGASAGVGRAIARAFARRGAHVALLARGADGVAAAAAEVEELGGRALALPVDVADADAVEAAATRVEDRFGPLDVWVNDAMATILAPVHATSAHEFERATRVTYLGAVHGCGSPWSSCRPSTRRSSSGAWASLVEELRAQGVGEAPHRELRAAVGGLQRDRAVGQGRADLDDRAAVARSHASERGHRPANGTCGAATTSRAVSDESALDLTGYPGGTVLADPFGDEAHRVVEQPERSGTCGRLAGIALIADQT